MERVKWMNGQAIGYDGGEIDYYDCDVEKFKRITKEQRKRGGKNMFGRNRAVLTKGNV